MCVASFHYPDQEGPKNAAAAGCQETLWVGLRAQLDLRPLTEPLGDFGGVGAGGCFFFFWLCQIVGAALQLRGMWDLVP